MIADAGVYQNVVARRLYDEALNTEHQSILSIDKFRLQPRSVFIEQFFGEVREETQGVKKRPLLLDHRVDGDLAEHQRRRHGEAPPFVLVELFGGIGDPEPAAAQFYKAVFAARKRRAITRITLSAK
jgi:hypothetical protein